MTRGSPTGKTARSPSSSSASSSRSVGRSTPPTSSPRSTSAARWARPSASRRCARSSTASPTRSPRWGVEGGYFVDAARGRGVPRRAEVHPRHPAGGVQQPGVVQHRRQGRAAAGQRVLHPRRSTTRWTASSTGTAKRASSSRAARARASTCRRSAPATSCSTVAARPAARSASCAAPTRRPARSRAAARPAARPRWSSSTSITPTSKSSSGARSRRSARRGVLRDAGFDMDLDGSDSFSIQYQNANNSVRVSDEFMQAVIDDADWNLHGGHRRLRRAHRSRPRPVAPDRHGVVGVRRPGPAVRHDDQQVAHRPRHRAASTAPTRAASTCTSTTRRATWRRSTC